MIRAAIHDAQGQILRVICVPAGNVNLNLAAGEDWCQVDDGVRDDTHYIVAFNAVPMPPRPSRNHRFDFDSKAWVTPAAS